MSECGAENRPGSRFCKECGTALSRSCATCGSALEAGARFGDQCGLADEVAMATSTDVQARMMYAAALVAVDRAAGLNDSAFEAAVTFIEQAPHALTALNDEASKKVFADGVDAGLKAGRTEEGREVLDHMDARSGAERPQFITAHSARFRARVAAERGDNDGTESNFARAARIFEEIDSPFWVAVTRLEQAEWLAGSSRQREAEQLVAGARDT